jgi:hypothetical protein
MRDVQKKIDLSLEQHPDYSCLDSLSADVWRKIRGTRAFNTPGLVIPFGVKVSALVLVILAVAAVSEITLKRTVSPADPFDLRYFSYQTMESLNLASVNTYELTP